MQKNDCGCGCIVSLLVGAVLGIVVGYISYSTLIPGIVTALWIGFGIGIVTLLLLALLALFTNGRQERCVCKNGTCLAVSAIGTIITTIIGLAITIVTGSVLVSALIGLATLFLTATLINLFNLLLCLINANCGCRE